MQIYIQPALTVIGWAVMIFWAVKHLELSSEKNLTLQKAILKENHERELVKEIIHIYKDLAVSIDSLLQSGHSFITNLQLEQEDLSVPASFSAKNLVEPLNISYKRLSSDFNRLEMWINITPSIPHIEKMESVIEQFYAMFSLTGKNESTPAWLGLQAKLAVYQSTGEMGYESVLKNWSEVNIELLLIRKELVKAVTIVNSEVLNTYNDSNACGTN